MLFSIRRNLDFSFWYCTIFLLKEVGILPLAHTILCNCSTARLEHACLSNKYVVNSATSLFTTYELRCPCTLCSLHAILHLTGAHSFFSICSVFTLPIQKVQCHRLKMGRLAVQTRTMRIQRNARYVV